MQLPYLGDDAPSDEYYDAIVLYGSATVSPGAASGPNTAALANPHGLPMEINEVRVRIYPLNVNSTDFGTLTGLSVAMKFDMGAIAISDAHVPVSVTSNFREFLNLSGALIPQSDPNVVSTPAAYQWRLKYPLFVPTGAVLTPVFTHLGQNSFPVVVDVMYFGRNLPPDYKPPPQVMIPWLSAWNSKSYDNVANTSASGETSSELDIINPYSTPLEIARLTGDATLISASPGTQTASIDQEDHVFRLATLTIRGSRGDEIVRSPTVWNTLFPTDWFAWDIPGGWILRPGEFYKVTLRVAAVDYTPAPDSDAGVGRVQYSIGAVGYRPIDSRTVMTQALESAPS